MNRRELVEEYAEKMADYTMEFLSKLPPEERERRMMAFASVATASECAALVCAGCDTGKPTYGKHGRHRVIVTDAKGREVTRSVDCIARPILLRFFPDQDSSSKEGADGR